MKNFLLIVAVSILCLQMPGYVYCDSLSLDTSNWKLVRGLAQDAGVGHQLKYQINVPVGFTFYLEADSKNLSIGEPLVTAYGGDYVYKQCVGAEKGENKSTTAITVVGVTYFGGYYLLNSAGQDYCYYKRYANFNSQLEEIYEFKLLVNNKSVEVSFSVLYPKSQESNYSRDELLNLFAKVIPTFKIED